MELNLGGLETITFPTVDAIRHCIQHMPVQSPYVILSDPAGFIQATYTGLDFRVEYRVDGHTQYYCLVDYETACGLFLDFRAGNTNYQSSVEWKRLTPQTIWNTPNHPIVVALLCIIGLLAIVAMIWRAFQ